MNCKLTTIRLKKDFVSSSLQSNSFSCSRFKVSAIVLRTLLPSGIVTCPTPKSTLGMNGVLARQLSILQEKNMQLHKKTDWLADEQLLTSPCYLQFDRWLIPQR
jgi:hypothetical protein